MLRGNNERKGAKMYRFMLIVAALLGLAAPAMACDFPIVEDPNGGGDPVLQARFAAPVFHATTTTYYSAPAPVVFEAAPLRVQQVGFFGAGPAFNRGFRQGRRQANFNAGFNAGAFGAPVIAVPRGCGPRGCGPRGVIIFR